MTLPFVPYTNSPGKRSNLLGPSLSPWPSCPRCTNARKSPCLHCQSRRRHRRPQSQADRPTGRRWTRRTASLVTPPWTWLSSGHCGRKGVRKESHSTIYFVYLVELPARPNGCTFTPHPVGQSYYKLIHNWKHKRPVFAFLCHQPSCITQNFMWNCPLFLYFEMVGFICFYAFWQKMIRSTWIK